MAATARSDWCVGFEVEVALGDLGEVRFMDRDEPMDRATPGYCRAVARRLTEMTGVRWSAPRGHRYRSGFNVVSEYDLDPLHWPEHLVAGVELKTPPLPFAEADEMRRRIAEAIFDMDGWDNAEREFADGFGWHINVDAPGEGAPDPARFAAGVDEGAMLRRSGRYGSRYTALQRHSFGVPLLRNLRVPGGARRLRGGFENFLNQTLMDGKSFAANFRRDSYAELRHYGAADFLDEAPLEELIGPVLDAFRMNHASFNAAAEHTVRLFEVLRGWIDEVGPAADFRLEPKRVVSGEGGELLFDGAPAGWLGWDGALEINVEGAEPWSRAAAVGMLNLADFHDGLAVAALDIAEARQARKKTVLRNQALGDVIDDLRRRIAAKRLFRRSPVSTRHDWHPSTESEPTPSLANRNPPEAK